MSQNKALYARVTPKQYKDVKEYCSKYGLSLSSFIRMVTFKAMKD